jgi:hypothetical protein
LNSPSSLLKNLESESYEYFDRHVRKLPRNSNGEIDLTNTVTWGNDIDAFRHAYASGVFTHEFGESAAKLAGWLNEKIGTQSHPSDENMDHWNNAVGRRLAKFYKTRDTLAKAVKEAMDRGELILSAEDSRKYEGAGLSHHKGIVVVLKESRTGANELFFDTLSSTTMTKSEFITSIENGLYPDYEIRTINGDTFPASKKDGIPNNNLS